MAGEYQLAQEIVSTCMTSSHAQGMDRDVLLRALLNAVVSACQEQRSNKDIVHELSFLIDQLEDDVAPITRGS